MLYNALSFHKKEHVLVIRLPEGHKDKESQIELANELFDLCVDVGKDRETRLVVIRLEQQAPFSGEALDWGAPSLAESVSTLDVPTLCAVNGYAIDRFLELALAADLRMASSSSFFGWPSFRSGGMPSDGGTQRLPRIVGRAKALELFFTGRMIDAKEALRIGLINGVTEREELDERVMQVAREMADKAPISMKFVKEAVYKGMDLRLEDGLRLESDLYFLLQTSRDRVEGIRAFQEKRRGSFEGM